MKFLSNLLSSDNKKQSRSKSRGFTSVELLLASVIFGIIVIGISNAYDAVRKSYTVARQLNEIYAVLSACPEIDRALDYTSLTSSTNCSPNNSFINEGGGGGNTTYAPTLSVTETSSLSASDPLRTVPDSKVLDINVAFPHSSATPLGLRMLVTRNGIGQL